MRRESPSSSGLLPSSYSRRRRNNNRPNESLTMADGQHYQTTTSTNTYEEVGNVNVGSSNSNSNSNDGTSNNNYLGLTSRRTPTRHQIKQPSTFAMAAYNNFHTTKSSDDDDDDDDDDGNNSENDENNNRQQYNNHNNNNNNRIIDDSQYYDDGYEDVLDKPLKLSDFLINDKCYQRYLSEGKRSSYRGITNGKITQSSSDNNSNNKGFMDPIFLAKVCAGASFVGMIFLIFVAIIMETQPLYIKGVSVVIQNNNNNDNANADYNSYNGRFRKETSNALKAAAAYFLTMVCSLIYLQAREMNIELNQHPTIGRICHLRRLIVSTYFRYRRRHYDTIPDNDHGCILPLHNSTGITSTSNKEGDLLLKSRRRKKRTSKRRNQENQSDGGSGSGSSGGGAMMGGILGKITKILGGSSQSGRKKDR